MPFNYALAKRDGHTDAEIADYLASNAMFNIARARQDGHNDADIIKHLQAQEAERASRDASKPSGPAVRTDPKRAAQVARSTFRPDEKPNIDTRDPNWSRVASSNPISRAVEEQVGIRNRVSDGAITSARAPDPSVSSLIEGARANFGAMEEGAKQIISDTGAAGSFLNPAQLAASQASQMRDTIQAQAETDRVRPQFDGPIASGAYGVGESIIQNLPGLLASVATGSPIPGLAYAGAATGVQDYGKFRARGATPEEAGLGGLGTGSIEVATELLPMGKYLDALGGPKNAKTFFTEVGKATLSDVPGEQIATLAQDAIDTAIANPNKTWGDYWKERPNAALQTLVTTIGQGAVMAGGGYAVNRTVTGKDAPTPAGEPSIVPDSFSPDRAGIVPQIGTRPIPAGEVEAASALTDDDRASPLPDSLLAKGLPAIRGQEAGGRADAILAEAGLPKTKTRVTVDMGDGPVTGVIEDAFATDQGRGVKIKLDDGRVYQNYFDDITDAGDAIVAAPQTAAEITASMTRDAEVARAEADQAIANMVVAPPVSPPTPSPATPLPDAPAVSGNDAVTGYMAKTRSAESAGNDAAKNQRSTATGRYQFTNGTWLRTYEQEFGKTGETPEQILAKRADGATQDRLMRRLTEANAAALRQGGHEVTEGNLYLAHFAGSGGANALLSADPNTPVEAVLGRGAVEANPFLRGKTAADVVRWAASKMGGNSSVAAMLPPTPDQAYVDPYQQAMEDYQRWEEGRQASAEPDAPMPSIALSENESSSASAPPFGLDAADGTRPVDGGQPVASSELLAREPPLATEAAAAEYLASSPDRAVDAGAPQQLGGGVAVDGAAGPFDIRGEAIDREWTRFRPDSGTLAIPRDEMPQIKAENRGAMVNFLNARGIAHEEQTVPASDLKPTQAEFSEAKVQKAKGYDGGNRAILVSGDGYVVDGHHQWMAARDNREDVRVIRLDAPIRELINTVREMPSVETAAGEDVPEITTPRPLRQLIDSKKVGQPVPTMSPAEQPTPAARVEPAEIAAAGSEAALPPAASTPAASNPQAAPVDMLKFISRAGGLSYDGLSEQSRKEGAKGHDLRNSGSMRAFVPGAGPLLRPGGLSLDEMGEKLWDAGYFGPPEVTPRPTENQVMDTIDDLLRRREKRYPGFAQPVAKPALPTAADRDMAETETQAERLLNVRDAWDDAAARLGLPPMFQSEIDQVRTSVGQGTEMMAPLDPEETDPDVIAAYIIEAANRELDAVRQAAFDMVQDELYGEVETQPSGPDAAEDQDRGTGVPGPTPDARDQGARARRSEDGPDRPQADRAESGLDLGEAVDPAIAQRQRQETRLRADAPMRGQNRTGQAQDGTMGMGLFDAADQPQMDLAPPRVQSKPDQETGRKAKKLGENPHLNNGDKVKLSEGVDYLRADETYTVSAATRKSAYFRNDSTGSGTVLPTWQIKQALADGRMKLTHAAKQSISGQPVATLAGDELGVDFQGPEDMPALRDAAREFYRREYIGKTVTSSDGHPVEFSTRALRKVTSKGPDLIRAIPAIGRIIEQGEVVDTRPGRDPSTKAMHLYAADVEIAGETKRLGVFVRETYDGRYQYDLTSVNEGAGSRSLLTDGVGAETPNAPALEVTPGGINLFLLDENYNSEPGTADPALIERLQTRLAELKLDGRVRLAVSNLIAGDSRIAGSYQDGLISLALEARQSASRTLDHEAVHAMRDLGLFRDAEWRALAAAAARDKPLMASVKRRYAGLSAEEQIEEAVADRFMKWAAGRQERGFVARAFERVREFLSAVGQVLRGEGLITPASVMRAIDRGAIGARAGGAGSGPSRYSITEPLNDAGHRDFDLSGTTAEPVNVITAILGGPRLETIREKIDDWRVVVQDKMLPVLRAQERTAEVLGRDIAEAENPYLAEELMSGRVGAQLEELGTEIIDPLFQAMHESGVSVDELETFLYARHAKERNAQIAKINPEFSQGEGSGMTDTQARAILNRIGKARKRETMDALAAYVDRMNAQALQTRVDAGLLSEEEAQAWRDTYEHYVPLRGQAEVEGDVGQASARVRSQSGVSVKGKEGKRAFGRRSEADNILSYAILQAEEAIVRAEKNHVAQSFVALARANPDQEFWTINKVERRPVMDKTSGLVRYEMQSRLSAEDAPYTVTAKIGGDEVRVTMNRDNPAAVKVAEAMRNLEDPKFNRFMAVASTFNRYFSAINTRYNPAFIITNAVRDLQTMAVIGQQFDLPGFTRKVVRDYVSAMTATKRGDSEWSQWRREWELAGGKVYYNDSRDVREVRDSLEKRAKALNSPNAAARAWRTMFDYIEAANDSVERAIRLSVYKNAREAGKSKAEAASMSRNITVNFTRKGRIGPAMNAFYAFFNASTQGSANLILAASKSKKVRAAMMGFVAAGFFTDMLNAMLSGDDDDGESFWDKMPAHEKGRNVVLMWPQDENGKATKIPLAYGLNALFGLGRNASAMMRGAMKPGEAIMASAAEFAGAFNPVGDGGTWLNVLAPTLLDPAIDITENKDFTGKPIQPEANPFEPAPTPSSNYFPSVSGWAKTAAQALNKATGGDEVLPGAASVSPEVIEYLTGFLTGGVGRFLSDTTKIVTAPLDPEADMTVRDVPIAKSLVTEKAPWVDKTRYYDRVHEVEQVMARAKAYGERGDREGLSAYVEEQAKIGKMEAATREASKLMSAVRKERNAASFEHELGRIDDTTFRNRLTRAQEVEGRIVSAYNTQWNQVMEAN